MIHTSLSPNTEASDVWLAFRTLFSPWLWNDQKIRITLEAELAKKLFGDKFEDKPGFVSTVDSGRTGLFTLLRAFNIGAGDEVIVQSYTCVAVPGPILWTGATPVYADCEDDFTMSPTDLVRKISSRTKAIVVQHTFGQPARLQVILKIARERNLIVIEDCAHSLGGVAEMGVSGDGSAGKALGSFGDAAFFSFGRDKSISSVFGGAIVVRSEQLHQKIIALVNEYDRPRTLWVIQQLMHPLVLAKAKFTYNIFSIGKIILEIAKRLNIISKAVQVRELDGGIPTFAFRQFSPALARLALQQIKKLDRFTTHRQELARFYAEQLNAFNGFNLNSNSSNSAPKIVAPAFVPGHSYLRYTLTTETPEIRTEIFAQARKKGIQLGDWYTTPIAPKGVQHEPIGYEVGVCPNAERLAALSFNLPTHIGISKSDARKIVSLITSVITSHN